MSDAEPVEGAGVAQGAGAADQSAAAPTRAPAPERVHMGSAEERQSLKERFKERFKDSLNRRASAMSQGLRAAISGGGEDRTDRFTEKAKVTLMLSQQEAQRFNHNYIGTEHLLLALLRSDGVAGKVLEALEIGLDQAREAVEYVIGRGDQPISGDLSLTPRAKKVIELSVEEARRLNHSHIGTEHLLLGLVAEGEGIGAGVLETLGADLPRVREKVLELTRNGGAPESMGTRHNVITCRVDAPDLWAMDLLVEAGIRSTRSDAAQWLIHAGIEAHKGLFEEVQSTVAEIRRLRERARQIAAGSA